MSVKDFQLMAQHRSYHIVLISKKLNKLKIKNQQCSLDSSENQSHRAIYCDKRDRHVSDYKKLNLTKVNTHKQRTSMGTSAEIEKLKL